MRDSCGAEKIFQLLEKQLAHFGITNMQTSIVSTVFYGASVVSTDEGNDSSKPAQSGNRRFKIVLDQQRSTKV